ncbi:MAG: bacteriohemerythrin [bacterium]
MDKIIWKIEYSVGVKEIDEQHQHFFSVLNELYISQYANKEKEWMLHIFEQLDGYIRFHFATEEKYFDEIKYEYSDQHKKSHHEFINKIESLKQGFEDGKTNVAESLATYLEDWFVNHIDKADKKYTDIFHKNNIY